MTTARTPAQRRRRTAAPSPTPSTARRRAFIYLRVSLDPTGERLTVRRHEKDCRALCAQRGWDVARVFTDNSVSAKGDVYRKDFAAMLEAIAAGGVDVVVAWALDRFVRSARDRLTLVETCREHGVMISLVQGSDMDPATAAGRMIIDVIGGAAQMEIDMKSERQQSAALQRATLGRPPLGTRLTGYTPKGEIVPEEAALVRRIFALFHAGESLRSIARTLTDEGVTTHATNAEIARTAKRAEQTRDALSTGRPDPHANLPAKKRRVSPEWNPSSITSILTNPRYAGRAIYNGEVIEGVNATWEPLVSGEVFDLVAARLSDPRRITNRVGTDRRHLGSGLYVCETCEAAVTSFSGARYRCKSACVNRAQRAVDAYVREVVAERLRRPDLAALLAPAGVDAAPLLDQMERLRARLATVAADYDAGVIDGLRYRAATSRVNTELAEVERELSTLRTGAALGELIASPDPAAAFLDAGLMAQRSVIDTLCTVRLRRGTRGSKVFDPATVQIVWRS
ncbi:recombinase family protein [Nocardia sp. 348MFTsu5.1]|uniref:recombinase family protein n=1 Tax=Nocardia sp. 348MFTsu5.1 TaxID=1172185 RepID=UPI00037941C5|nr:recombinase family protein [Nocardia sp. 348MFTsu5.1]